MYESSLPFLKEKWGINYRNVSSISSLLGPGSVLFWIAVLMKWFTTLSASNRHATWDVSTGLKQSRIKLLWDSKSFHFSGISQNWKSSSIWKVCWERQYGRRKSAQRVFSPNSVRYQGFGWQRSATLYPDLECHIIFHLQI